MVAELLNINPNTLERCGLCCFTHQPGVPEGLELPAKPCRSLNMDGPFPTCTVFKNPQHFNSICDNYICDCKTQLDTAVELILTSPEKFGIVLDHLKTRRLIPETEVEHQLTNPFASPNDIYKFFEKILVLEETHFKKILNTFSFEDYLKSNILYGLKTIDKAIAHLEYTKNQLPGHLADNTRYLLVKPQKHLRWNFVLSDYLNCRPVVPFPQNPDRKMARYLAGTSVLLPKLL